MNLKFRKLYRLAAHDTPTSKKLLKLQLGVIRISEIEIMKRRVPLLDLQPFVDGSSLIFSLAKAVDFELLEKLFGLGAPEAVLIDFVCGLTLGT